MFRLVLAIGFLVAYAAQIGPSSSPFATPSAFLIEPPRVGTIAVGMTIDQLYEQVGRDRTRLVDGFMEGFFGPVLHLIVEGGSTMAPAIEVAIRPRDTGFFVGSIGVRDPRFSTADGIRVGMRLGDLAGMAWPAVEYGEQGPCLVLEDRGLTLLILEPSGVDLRDGDIAPPDARVVVIYVVDRMPGHVPAR